MFNTAPAIERPAPQLGKHFIGRPGAVAQVNYAGSGRWVWESIEGRTFGCCVPSGEHYMLSEIDGVCAECRLAVVAVEFDGLLQECRS